MECGDGAAESMWGDEKTLAAWATWRFAEGILHSELAFVYSFRIFFSERMLR